LRIEQARFEERMQVEIDCPADLRDIAVPSLLLQPLAENAVKHGVARSRRPVTIRVTARRENAMLVLSVEDDALSTLDAAPGLGIGNGNIAQRLRARYGARASISTRAGPQGFTAEIRIPLD